MRTNIAASGMLSCRVLSGALVALFLCGGCASPAQNSEDTTASPAPVSENSGGIADSEIRDVVRRVARHQLQPLSDGDYPAVADLAAAEKARRPDGIGWNYPQGVMLYGMERSTDVTGDKAVDQFVVQHNLICARYYRWLSGLENQFGDAGRQFAGHTKIGALVKLGNLDSCGAMGTEMIVSMLRHPDEVTPDEKAVLARIADWVVRRQDRLPDGTLWRSREMGGTVWPDDLYMGGVFLVHYGLYTHDRKFIDDTASNIIHQAAMEQDHDGLWFHGYFVKQKRHAPFKWGRGNGWAMVTMVEDLSAMPEDDPLRAKVLAILRKQISGLKKVQAPDGMWRQVLDHPESWEETSCTAMFAYGIARAVNRGWINATNMVVARRAFAGIAKNVAPDGAVNGTCQGTNIGRTLDFYLDRRRPPNDPHGRGPTLLAGTEILMAAGK